MYIVIKYVILYTTKQIVNVHMCQVLHIELVSFYNFSQFF
jgi:hypothetical protein